MNPAELLFKLEYVTDEDEFDPSDVALDMRPVLATQDLHTRRIYNGSWLACAAWRLKGDLGHTMVYGVGMGDDSRDAEDDALRDVLHNLLKALRNASKKWGTWKLQELQQANVLSHDTSVLLQAWFQLCDPPSFLAINIVAVDDPLGGLRYPDAIVEVTVARPVSSPQARDKTPLFWEAKAFARIPYGYTITSPFVSQRDPSEIVHNRHEIRKLLEMIKMEYLHDANIVIVGNDVTAQLDRIGIAANKVINPIVDVGGVLAAAGKEVAVPRSPHNRAAHDLRRVLMIPPEMGFEVMCVKTDDWDAYAARM
ncbi:hypothetical protein DM02DRAFT_728098 [Periconia macrospinosa]|uniref:Uncharacterized protein n=1 Tax=Periconia macrospinosa TaxID=97972 RepID=A0A2V1DT01_9PLEO|nr:hypothetical protein DM02DRAFT_728098 [Periconia macrospinosa]